MSFTRVFHQFLTSFKFLSRYNHVIETSWIGEAENNSVERRYNPLFDLALPYEQITRFHESEPVKARKNW